MVNISMESEKNEVQRRNQTSMTVNTHYRITADS